MFPNARPRRPGTLRREHETNLLPTFLCGVFAMDSGIMESFIQLVQGVGFPIACAVAMFCMLNKEQKEHKEETAQISQAITDMRISNLESQAELKQEMTKAIDNNTTVLQRLLDKLEGN